jgi:hypothetical protein
MKITKQQLKQLIKETMTEQDSAGVAAARKNPPVAPGKQQKAYDARRELYALNTMMKQVSEKMSNLQENVYGKGYSNEETILDLAGKVYHVAKLIKKTAHGKN